MIVEDDQILFVLDKVDQELAEETGLLVHIPEGAIVNFSEMTGSRATYLRSSTLNVVAVSSAYLQEKLIFLRGPPWSLLPGSASEALDHIIALLRPEEDICRKGGASLG